jgi:putative two-component system response regulator
MAVVDELRSMRILVVDDEPANVELLERILADAGFSAVETSTDPRHALARCATHAPDLLLLDLHMPGIDGYALMEALGPRIRTTDGPPVVVLTADITIAARRRALDAGARDFVSKPFDHDEVLLRVRNLLELRRYERQLAGHNERLEAAVRERTSELEASRLEILDRLALVAEFRDDDTNDHARRIGHSSVLLAAGLDLESGMLELFGRAAALHDIGKVAISDTILLKPERLTAEEFATMQSHTTAGAHMLAGSQSPVLQLAERIALSHHERWDGKGYPRGLAGAAIPIEGRIVAIADVFDALTHDRPYKSAWSVADAVAEVRDAASVHFDPAVVAVFETLDHAALVDPPLAKLLDAG